MTRPNSKPNFFATAMRSMKARSTQRPPEGGRTPTDSTRECSCWPDRISLVFVKSGPRIDGRLPAASRRDPDAEHTEADDALCHGRRSRRQGVQSSSE